MAAVRHTQCQAVFLLGEHHAQTTVTTTVAPEHSNPRRSQSRKISYPYEGFSPRFTQYHIDSFEGPHDETPVPPLQTALSTRVQPWRCRVLNPEVTVQLVWAKFLALAQAKIA
jgi:hypothetical protein